MEKSIEIRTGGALIVFKVPGIWVKSATEAVATKASVKIYVPPKKDPVVLNMFSLKLLLTAIKENPEVEKYLDEYLPG